MRKLDALEALARLVVSDTTDRVGALTEAARIVGAVIGSDDVRMVAGDGVNFEAYPPREAEDFFGLSASGLMAASQGQRTLGRPAVYRVGRDRLPHDMVPCDGKRAGTHVAFGLWKGDTYGGTVVARGPWAAPAARHAGRFLEAAGPALAILLEQVVDADRTERVRQQMDVLSDVARVFTRAENMRDVLGDAANAINSATGFLSSIDVLDTSGRIVMRSTAASRYTGTPLYDAWLQMTRAPDLVRDSILKDPQSVLLPDLQTDPRISEETREFYRRASIVSGATFPLLFQHELVGLLRVGSLKPTSFDPPVVDFLQSLALQTAVVVKGVHLWEQLQRSEKETGRYASKLRARNQELLKEISERERAEGALRDSEARYRTLIETSPDAITLTDLDVNIVMVNRQAVALHGCESAEDMVGKSALEFIDPPDHQRATENAGKTLETGSVEGIQYSLMRRDGTRFPAEMSASLVRDAEGKPEFFIGVVRDISERKRFEARLAHLANHDPLTDLFNRRRFQEELQWQLAQAQRYGTRGALLFLDLDQFKDVNDSLGHRAGDELLASLAGLLRERLRDTDIVARAGGDEFAIFLPYADGDQAQAVARQLLQSIQHHAFMVCAQPVGITGCIGIALCPDHGSTAEELLSRADLAMYEAKENGPNHFGICSSGKDWQAEIESRLSWQNRIRQALEQNQFILHAQPILDLHDDTISQYELLLRLRGEEGIVAADSFIGIAERSGVIGAVDRWVISQAILLIAEQQRAGRELRLEVNLSGKALANGELLDHIRRELEATSADPASLVLEVTETAAIANITEAQRFITTLKELGCHFALDDFGVGFSSFYHLKHLPVDYLKIDGGFIRELPSSPVDQHLVRAIVQVARGLGKRTIAEFVGSDETVRLLREYGVDYAQGYHIGQPREVPEILADGALDADRVA